MTKNESIVKQLIEIVSMNNGTIEIEENFVEAHLVWGDYMLWCKLYLADIGTTYMVVDEVNEGSGFQWKTGFDKPLQDIMDRVLWYFL